ncbi:MAG: two-component regulator propeller domain-containing protein [Candidatus Pedobacter colombiensis]|uniref:histidine kinase n=1 Tax=Candidatus Pedobacter colombiensis TaxID=3121371 RepID=A0AAJ5W9B4_9SPHI|nr:hybrid sensor histidine kinase/response regulator transcription factor [Pedobacter sp.]WEK19541.1 MAG: two-component regulator propeller domain-containing protein [Pedobacter sp.]
MKIIKWRLINLCISILVLFHSTQAQNPVTFSNYTIENGLSQNSVISITQDKSDFMWFGTRQGLNRYDGYQFKSYINHPADRNSLSNNEVQAMLTDSEGTLWVGTANGLNRYDSKTDTFIQIHTRSKKGVNSGGIECLYEDPDKNLWVGTLRGLNLLTDKSKNTFKAFQFKGIKDDGIYTVYAIFKDSRGNLWIGTDSGLLCMSLKNGRYQYERFKYGAENKSGISSNYITCINADAQQNLWIGTSNGVCLFNYATKSFTVYGHDNKNPNSIVHNDIRTITRDQQGMLWIGTQEGLSILDPVSKKFTNYQHDPELKNSISHNSVHSIYQDVNKTMWVGTYFGGVNYSHLISTRFKTYQNSKLKSSISSNIVSSIVEDEHNNLWIGTEGGGLDYLDSKTNNYTIYKTNPKDPTSITSNLVKIMCKENSGKGELIIGTHYGGLNIFNPKTGQFKHILNVKDAKNTIGTAEILALRQDSYGTIWIGSRNGLTILRRQNGTFPDHTTKSVLDKYFKSKKGVQVLFEDGNKKLWLGTSAGLYRYNFSSRILTPFTKKENDSTRLQSDYINCVVQTTKGLICVGTYFGGISVYNEQTNHFKTYMEVDGLANNNVLGIVEDGSGNLWISTANGLSELNLNTGKFRNYTRSDGLAGNEFNARSYFKDSKGEIFLGGLNGLTSFHPKEIETNKYKAPVVFTGLKLFNQPIEVGGPDQLLKQQILSTKEITFKHDQNHFTLGFALLNYIKPDKNKYAYKLEGYDEQWNYTNNPSAIYTNLPSGSYHFIVKGLNNDGIPGSNQAGINIKILPPIWASWWAYVFYALLFSVILFLTVRYLFIRALLKRSEDVQKMKLNFFTYISHEIRTPLTLILGPLEHLLKTTKDNPEINKQVLPIKNNADRLMRLITELMDFRKVETGNLKLHVSSGNIIEFTQEIFHAFQHLADTRAIHYIFDHKQEYIELHFDKVQLEKVLFNLLSNAFKFTGGHGSIQVSIEETVQEVVLKVRDNGKGIPLESQQKLFSDFFQVDERGSGHIGSGIGLALSKSIVESHHGSIGIESNPATATQPGDTCFTLTLKKGKSHFKNNEFTDDQYHHSGNTIYTVPVAISNLEAETKITHGETILIVEDNPEIRQMLMGLLGTDYRLNETADGLDGWETAVELLPDLIICDVMMPVMDGLELCKKLKTDERTSHIPVILLTAKSSQIHQVDGLETGADCYITKPFNIDLLKLNIRNLLQSRATMRQKFSKEVNLQPQNITVSTVEHAFMIKIVQYIEDHMSEQDFNVPELAANIGMSQPVLYKKIRAITDLSVNDFIKTIRLKKAAQLFAQKTYNVSEVSYLVGFNDPKYFSREFKKQFGHTPKAYVNSLTEQES